MTPPPGGRGDTAVEAGEKVQAPSKERREPPLENEQGAPGKRGEDSESSAPLAGSTE